MTSGLKPVDDCGHLELQCERTLKMVGRAWIAAFCFMSYFMVVDAPEVYFGLIRKPLLGEFEGPEVVGWGWRSTADASRHPEVYKALIWWADAHVTRALTWLAIVFFEFGIEAVVTRARRRLRPYLAIMLIRMSLRLFVIFSWLILSTLFWGLNQERETRIILSGALAQNPSSATTSSLNLS